MKKRTPRETELRTQQQMLARIERQIDEGGEEHEPCAARVTELRRLIKLLSHQSDAQFTVWQKS